MEAKDRFNMMASKYDREERIVVTDKIAEKISTHIVNGQDKTLLDFGCGTGLVGLKLVDDVNEVIFMDIASNMIDEVNKKIKNMGIKNAKTITCDIFNDDVDLKVDYIIICQTLLHIKDVRGVLTRLFTLLNSGGHLLIADFDKNEDIVSDEVHNGFNQNELIDLVTELGFCDVTSSNFYHGENIFMKQDASIFLLDGKRADR